MAKRFPIPEFEYEELKRRPWTAPAVLDTAAASRLAQAAAGDAGAWGAHPVAAPDAYFDALNVRGAHRSAVLCLLPASGVTMTGRSHAWKIQRVAVTAGLPAGAPDLLLEWKTPRPMNTRLGPEHGIPAPAAAVTLVFGHRYADHWVASRVAVDTDWRPATGSGFRVLSCDDEDINDFHAAVVSFTWDA